MTAADHRDPVAELRARLAEVDRQRSIERGAENARSRLRLRHEPVARGGLLGFLRRRPEDRDEFFTRDETSAIYAALAVVRDNAQRRADELERGISAGADR